MAKKILFLSNGHGEDLNASLILEALLSIDPEISIAALPIVGEGNAYRKKNIPLLAPTSNLPSGGIIYTNPLNWLKDILGGLIGLTIQQIRSLLKFSPDHDLLVAVGDIVPITLAWLTGRPFVAFLVSTSSYYEDTIKLPYLTRYCLRSPRCLKIFTRDAYTAEDTRRQGFKNTVYAGYPIMDTLKPTGRDLQLEPDKPMIALLAGSRLPEALSNLGLELEICSEIAKIEPMQFLAAIVPAITETDLENLAGERDWRYLGEGRLRKGNAEVRCYRDAFADILYHCTGAIGMAGTAVEQAVGLGKPVLQIPGYGPQFTYPFAEAQNRLLGLSVITIGENPTEKDLFIKAARQIVESFHDKSYLNFCIENGSIRVGKAGGSVGIAREIYSLLEVLINKK